MSMLDAVGMALLLGWDRAVDPGRCAPNPAMGTRRCNMGTGWPAIPTRRSLDCAMPPGGVWGYFRKPPGKRSAWAKRRTLTRKAERAFVATLGHRVGAPWDC